jgi:hypothetical protein
MNEPLRAPCQDCTWYFATPAVVDGFHRKAGVALRWEPRQRIEAGATNFGYEVEAIVGGAVAADALGAPLAAGVSTAATSAAAPTRRVIRAPRAAEIHDMGDSLRRAGSRTLPEPGPRSIANTGGGVRAFV